MKRAGNAANCRRPFELGTIKNPIKFKTGATALAGQKTTPCRASAFCLAHEVIYNGQTTKSSSDSDNTSWPEITTPLTKRHTFSGPPHKPQLCRSLGAGERLA